jgi:hypothetical protein
MMRPTVLATGLSGAVVTVAPIGYRSPPPHRHSSGTPVKPYRASGPVMAEGSKAAARRRRQIECGQLKAANGLARSA